MDKFGVYWSSNLLSCFLLLSSGLIQAAALGDPTSSENRAEGGGFELVVEGDLISLRASGASIVEILWAFEEQTGIEIVSDVPAEDTLTVSFEALTLQQALGELSANTVYEWSTSDERDALTRVFVLKAGTTNPGVGGSDSKPANLPRTEGAPEPFKFQFDPSEHLKEPE